MILNKLENLILVLYIYLAFSVRDVTDNNIYPIHFSFFTSFYDAGG